MNRLRRLLIFICIFYAKISWAEAESIEAQVLMQDAVYYKSLADKGMQTSSLLHPDFQCLTAYGMTFPPILAP